MLQEMAQFICLRRLNFEREKSHHVSQGEAWNISYKKMIEFQVGLEKNLCLYIIVSFLLENWI